MSLTIDSILNFNSYEVENGFFYPQFQTPTEEIYTSLYVKTREGYH